MTSELRTVEQNEKREKIMNYLIPGPPQNCRRAQSILTVPGPFPVQLRRVIACAAVVRHDVGLSDSCRPVVVVFVMFVVYVTRGAPFRSRPFHTCRVKRRNRVTISSARRPAKFTYRRHGCMRLLPYDFGPTVSPLLVPLRRTPRA